MQRSETLSPTMTRPGSAREVDVSSWRTQKPVIDYEKCTNCLICWVYCPEPAIVVEMGRVRVDYVHCKGCGICAAECPRKAVVMEVE
ncbi:MAG: 4Fe-4S binding protein [Candidatus Caldarchaeum sp.]|nr:4Fe-4S binding protein [Candidatus Caldarchaeum sp.]MCS7094690.1 4Fe-4S binding protein [Candidatus Calditenuaceae archaeon]MDW8186928.1 4Fe-4S binding protein [Nitrososphaerota archaeon]MDW8359741.1 4Fe-4S binding protein [Candidatus Caldarchaeum sp.]